MYTDQPAEEKNVHGKVDGLLGRYSVIALLDFLTWLFMWVYRFVFFRILHTFIPLKNGIPVRILAFFASSMFTGVTVYLNNLSNILLPLFAFFIYACIFHQERITEKITTVLIFYPIMISVNFLMQNVFSQIFFAVTNAPAEPGPGWTDTDWLVSSALYTLSHLTRILFWIGVSRFLKEPLHQIRFNLSIKMWLIVDSIITVAAVACFTTLYFITDHPEIVYPLCVTAVFSSLGCIYLVAYMSKSTQDMYNMQKMQMQQKYYEDKLKDEERVRAVYHDMKNHLLVLEGAQGTEATRKMAKELRAQIVDYEDYIHTGNDFLDIIIRDKAEKSREKQIDFSAFIDFGDIDFIEPLDISTLFGNGIDNAIEASGKLPEDQRVIAVKAGRVNDFISILIENNCMEEQAADKTGKHRTTKADSFLHGFGITNMEKTAEKYGGTCTTRQEDGKFTLKILLPVIKKS